MTSDHTVFLADGKDSAEYTAAVTDQYGNPVTGVDLTADLSKSNGVQTTDGKTTWALDTAGKATISFTTTVAGTHSIAFSVPDSANAKAGAGTVNITFVAACAIDPVTGVRPILYAKATSVVPETAVINRQTLTWDSGWHISGRDLVSADPAAAGTHEKSIEMQLPRGLSVTGGAKVIARAVVYENGRTPASDYTMIGSRVGIAKDSSGSPASDGHFPDTGEGLKVFNAYTEPGNMAALLPPISSYVHADFKVDKTATGWGYYSLSYARADVKTLVSKTYRVAKIIGVNAGLVTLTHLNIASSRRSLSLKFCNARGATPSPPFSVNQNPIQSKPFSTRPMKVLSGCCSNPACAKCRFSILTARLRCHRVGDSIRKSSMYRAYVTWRFLLKTLSVSVRWKAASRGSVCNTIRPFPLDAMNNIFTVCLPVFF
ncbi:Ig-like domain-containing protein [Salmonella enterica]|nr:Ig-like domain-containing protein [Salmonella enterica]ELF4914048.1 Ig-like domain-containing protein [Salmonella enterica]